MLKNMGSWDRVIRVVVALTVAVLLLTGSVSGTAAILLGIVALIFLSTSFIGFCPLYAPCHISTKKANMDKPN